MLITDEVLLNYKRCSRRVFLNAYGDRTLQQPEADFLGKLKRESQTQVNRVLTRYFPNYIRPSASQDSWQQLAESTIAVMAEGVDCIYDGLLTLTLNSADGEVVLVSRPTLLVKEAGFSRFGDWLYVPINVHLGRRPKSEYKILAAFATKLLTATQGILPPAARLILRQLDCHEVKLYSWLEKTQASIDECVTMLRNKNEPEVFISRQRCSLCHWYNHCYNVARQQQHLSLVPGVTPSRYQSLQTLGITSVQSLVQICLTSLGAVTSKDIAIKLQQQARSLAENKPIWREDLSTSNSHRTIPAAEVEIYFDIEAEPERGVDYLFGVLLVDRYQQKQHFLPFLAETPAEEGVIWQKFLAFLALYPDAPIFHFSEYEAETIQRLGKLYQTPQAQINSILARCFDLYDWVMATVVFPVERYSLKSLANWLGFNWRLPGVSGDRCVCWYDDWLTNGDRRFLESILTYNEDDCLATLHLKNWLSEFIDRENQ
jgi:predicted RecB family nuclease